MRTKAPVSGVVLPLTVSYGVMTDPAVLSGLSLVLLRAVPRHGEDQEPTLSHESGTCPRLATVAGFSEKVMPEVRAER